MSSHVSTSNAGRALEHIVSTLESLPALPETVVRVVQLTRDPDLRPDDLAKAITRDQSLTANVLRLCNSAHYGLPRVISSIHQAILYLGFCTIRTLVLTSSVRGYLEQPLEGYGYGRGGLWRHSVAVALAAQTLCRRQRPDLEDVAYTAGLLHDIGKVVLSNYLTHYVEEIQRRTREEGTPLISVEREILGVDHAELGGDIACRWNFPDELVHTIRYHHNLEREGKPTYLLCVVHVADAVAWRLGLGPAQEEPYFEPFPPAMEALGLTPDAYERYCETVVSVLDAAQEFLV